jgi:hypothetical protein
MCGIFALTGAVSLVEPLLFGQLKTSNAWRVAIDWFAEAAASIVVVIFV